MRWERRFDIPQRREVLELVVSEEEAAALADLIPLHDNRIHPTWRALGEAIAAKPADDREGLAAFVGKWPGDETDKEIEEALHELS